MKQVSIPLFDSFGKNILIRSKMREFFKEINKMKSDKISLNFDKIEFISRSCADEYIKLKLESDKVIVEIKVAKNVLEMLEVVHESRKNFFQAKESCMKPTIPCCN